MRVPFATPEGVKRIEKVTDGVLNVMWALQNMEKEQPEVYDVEKMSREEIMIGKQIASGLIRIRDGLEVGK